jgi:hypothetical protein
MAAILADKLSREVRDRSRMEEPATTIMTASAAAFLQNQAPERTSVFRNCQSHLHEFAPIRDRNARLILSKNLLASKAPDAYHPETMVVKFILGRRYNMAVASG